MIKKKKYNIYLDYAATTPLCEEASQAMLPYFENVGKQSLEYRGNPNSLYSYGRQNFSRLENARKSVSDILGANRPSEIVFTSGATESIYLCMSGLFRANSLETIIISPIEHSAIINAAKAIAGKDNIIFAEVDEFGFVNPDKLQSILEKNPNSLVSIQMANSEIGTIQDITAISAICKKYDARFMSDITQAVGKIKINLEELNIDGACFSAHKFLGPVGVGGLYINRKVDFSSPIIGGGQESSKRGGTQNVAGVVGLEAALRQAYLNFDKEYLRLKYIKKYLRENVEKIQINNNFFKCTIDEENAREKDEKIDFLPNIVHITMPGIESETAIIQLDELGIYVSGGSACSSHSLKTSKVLNAIGINDDRAKCALRVSFGKFIEKEDIDIFLNALEGIV